METLGNLLNILFSMRTVYNDPRNHISFRSRIGEAGNQYPMLVEKI